MDWSNIVTRLLKVRYPILQAPMLVISSPEMVAAVSNEGGLGSLPVGGLSGERTAELIRQTRKLTDKPFAVNLFAHDIPKVKKPELARMSEYLAKLGQQNGIPYQDQAPETLRFHSYLDQVDILLEEKIPIVSFTFGVLRDEVIQTFKSKGVILAGTATCVEEALLLDEKGIDLIIAQGMEAGGHRGSFLFEESPPLIGSFCLIPLVTEKVKRPVIAAGGIMDGKTIKAAFILGARGVQLGTAFLASTESMAIPSYKRTLQKTSENEIVLTRSFTGRWARGVRNKFMTSVDKSGIAIPAYPVQNSLTIPLRTAAQKGDNKDFTTMFAGQAASKARSAGSSEIFRNLVRETEMT